MENNSDESSDSMDDEINSWFHKKNDDGIIDDYDLDSKS